MNFVILFIRFWNLWKYILFDKIFLYRPSYGGRYCIGERKRYKVCNTEVIKEFYNLNNNLIFFLLFSLVNQIIRVFVRLNAVHSIIFHLKVKSTNGSPY